MVVSPCCSGVWMFPEYLITLLRLSYYLLPFRLWPAEVRITASKWKIFSQQHCVNVKNTKVANMAAIYLGILLRHGLVEGSHTGLLSATRLISICIGSLSTFTNYYTMLPPWTCRKNNNHREWKEAWAWRDSWRIPPCTFTRAPLIHHQGDLSQPGTIK